MNRFSAAAGLVALAVASALPRAGLASGSSAIQHCRGVDGVAVYTDRACSTLGAQPVSLSSDLVRRIAATGTHAAYRAPTRTAHARRAASNGCARSATQLASDLEGAFALGDVNRIAESYHWVGMSHRQGQQVMQRLSQLSREPLLQAHYIDARIRSGWGGSIRVADATAALSSGAGMMQLVFGEGRASHAMDLDVQRYHGCYFVRFP